jgi:hypothetical protein
MGGKKRRRRSHKKTKDDKEDKKDKKKKLLPKERYEKGRTRYVDRAKEYYSGNKYVERGKDVMRSGRIIPQKPQPQPVDPHRAGMLYSGRGDYNLNAGLEAQIAQQQKMSELSAKQIAMAQKEQELKLDMIRHDQHLKLISQYGDQAAAVGNHITKLTQQYLHGDRDLNFDDLAALKLQLHPPTTEVGVQQGATQFQDSWSQQTKGDVIHKTPQGMPYFENYVQDTVAARTPATPRTDQWNFPATPQTTHEEQLTDGFGRTVKLTIHSDGRNTLGVDNDQPVDYADALSTAAVLKKIGVPFEKIENLHQRMTLPSRLPVPVRG